MIENAKIIIDEAGIVPGELLPAVAVEQLPEGRGENALGIQDGRTPLSPFSVLWRSPSLLGTTGG